ncbi:MAG TPA: hypothetical protein VK086_09200 [Ruania sp.]|nr:hypothetical protein [Ruania sp.]
MTVAVRICRKDESRTTQQGRATQQDKTTQQGKEAVTMMSTAIRGTTTHAVYWPSRVELNRATSSRAAAQHMPAHRVIVRLGAALMRWGRRSAAGAGREPYLQAHQERLALLAAIRHDGLPLG